MRTIPKSAPVHGALAAPPSKAMTLRSLLLAANGGGTTLIRDALDMDDSRYVLQTLQKIGFETGGTFRSGLTIGERPGLSANDVEIDLADAASAIPLVVGFLAFTPGRFIVRGRTAESSLSSLVERLQRIGAEIEYAQAEGSLPLRIRGKVVRGGFEIDLDEAMSPDFPTSLLLSLRQIHAGFDASGAAPWPATAQLTRNMVEAAGARIDTAAGVKRIEAAELSVSEISVEGDYGATAHWLMAAAATGGTMDVSSLPEASSVQPEEAIVAALSAAGVAIRRTGRAVAVGEGGIEGGAIDVSRIDTLVPLLALTAPAARSPLTLEGLRGVQRRQPQLLERITATLSAMGARAEVQPDRLIIQPGWTSADVQPDHGGDPRMVMAMAIAGLSRGGVTIHDESVVSQEYPRFWRTLDELLREA